MTTKLAQFVSIMLYVLVAGVMWGTWLSLGRTMTRYDAATFLADGKQMIANLAAVMAVLMVAAGVAGVLTVALLFRGGSRVGAGLALAGLLLMVAVLVVTLAVEVPLDNRIRTWTVATLPSDWQGLRERWAAFHTLRTFLALGSVAAAVAAALVGRPDRTGPAVAHRAAAVGDRGTRSIGWWHDRVAGGLVIRPGAQAAPSSVSRADFASSPPM
jgi:hypothetical protein